MNSLAMLLHRMFGSRQAIAWSAKDVTRLAERADEEAKREKADDDDKDHAA